ncbi:hypothetical protein PGTUg99_029827 [Puccinia graminis f. sp. tritici]|uniref:Uncharacterized protein n=1 Tax=Puccinia graminis f. sp. tritici TaxID=56615 RepID=A0A5B0S8R2_PUCGR|nr:hypothetical protein PGTUg99_029827 [Puccinia graminis f. sp. tritici]
MEADARFASRYVVDQDDDTDDTGTDLDKDNDDDRKSDRSDQSDSNRSNQSHDVSELDLQHVVLSRSHSPERAGTTDSNVYDCSRYYKFSLRHADPAVLHISLLTAMLAIFDHASFARSSWLLKCGKDLLALTAATGLGQPRKKGVDKRTPAPLAHAKPHARWGLACTPARQRKLACGPARQSTECRPACRPARQAFAAVP